MRELPPNPKNFSDAKAWALAFYEFFVSQSSIEGQVDPTPLLLAYKSQGINERASVDGLFLYDPVYETPVVSESGVWEPTRTQPLFSIIYGEDFATDGAAIGIGGAKIPFSTIEVDLASWATFNVLTNDFTLLEGQYDINGYVVLTKVAGGAKRFTGYLAQTSALTNPVGDVRMGSLYVPAGADNLTTHVVYFSGQVSVPTGGETYAMVVNTPDADTRFGTAHGISSFQPNLYARLSISLVGTNS